MRGVERLIAPGRSVLMQLEQASTLAWPFIQAEAVLVVHRCAALARLLTPLALVNDPGLRHALMTDSAVQTSAAPRTAPPTASIPAPSAENPAPRAPFSVQSAHRTVPALPAGCDFPRSQQLVRSLLDRWAAELAFPSSGGGLGRSSLVDQAPGSDPKPTPTSVDPAIGKRSFSSGPPRTGDRFVSSLTHELQPSAPETSEAQWLHRHPAHRTTAGRVVAPARQTAVNLLALRQWASAPTAISVTERSSHGQSDATGAASTTAAIANQPGSLHHPAPAPADQSRLNPLSSDNFALPVSHSASAASSQEPVASMPAPAVNQLELLVRKWQEHQETPRSTLTDVPPGDNRQQRLHTLTAHPNRRRPTDTHSLTEYADSRLHSLNGQADGLENDLTFAATLGRVLAREIRRHGLEEGT